MNWRKMKLSWTTASEAISCNSIHMYFNNYVFISGNCTPGSRSTSDLVYTWADFFFASTSLYSSKAACIV